MNSRPRIRICCISSVEEANLAVLAGADAIGLVGEMPSGPGVIDDRLIREIAASIPPAIGTFLLTERTTASEIADHVAYCGTNTVQVVNHIDPGEWPKLQEQLPAATRRVQVIHVEDEAALELVEQYAHFVHAILLDSGQPSATVAKLGGTGKIHNWDISARIVELSPKPVFLAGGINEANVRHAVSKVKPFGLDLCSSVRIDGSLSRQKLFAFMEAASA